jgi:hypothetical protein
MPWSPPEQIISCAALLLAAILIRLLPSFVRRALFIVMFATGVMAFIVGAASDFGNAAVVRLFG